VLVRDYILIAILVVSLLVWVYKRHLRSNVEKKLKIRGLSKHWSKFLVRNVLIYRRLPRRYRSELHGYINVFLHDKQFIECDGLEMTDEIRLTIAAQACILLLCRRMAVFPDFHSVLVYPTAYYAQEKVFDGLVVSNKRSLRSGESWEKGIVVLSWEDIVNESQGESPGNNVIIHEFAHRLDQQNTSSEGVPLLDSGALYKQWASVLGCEFNMLKDELQRGQETVIDAYAATSPAEFFAVVTEMFFELPGTLETNHSELYNQLRDYYQLDPARW